MPEAAAVARAAGEKRYASSRPCPQGHISERFTSNNGCVECLRLHAKKYYSRNLEVMQKRSGAWARRNPEQNAARARRWYHKSDHNRKLVKAARDQWRLDNPERMRLQGRLTSQRRRCRLVVPAWADLAAIAKFYGDCPAGRNVCGLHVENNFQYLTKSDNSRKGNKWVP